MRFEGQTAIVTGAARGIGLGIAKRLAAEGARVALWDLDWSSFDRHMAGFEPADLREADVSDLSSIEAAFAASLEKLGQVDILVNNAGINGPIEKSWNYPVDAWHKVLAVDLNSVFFCCRAAVPHMIERRYGRIVNIASIAGKEGGAGLSAYSAAKAGVIGFTKSLARELVESGVLANCIAPVIAETDLLKQQTPEFTAAARAKIPMNRFLTVEEIAATAAFAASRECSFTTGFTFDVSGGRATY
ncbi:MULTISPECIES: SDR family NAD(P)-dependent oxidoreductase [Bosea]|uniref:3-oxoacyl-[acyl-carrier protein] reductase n=1 Tax=Bosea robiniae TaxID=1036780 RepID=A0ABY0NTY6_9HYPH|nr:MULTISPECIES: SDR family NAD(P)-dependent oxidoreductase [Bosea]SDG13595.1 3-oxoacyl-[acyl-carrier protein] reductase [Bosea robiniae]